MPDRDPPIRRATWGLAVVGAAMTLLLIAFESPRALVFLATDGVIATGVLVSASLAGLWWVALLRLEDLPLRWHLLLGAGFGIGALSLLVLALGLVGFLHRTLWVVLLAGGGLAGFLRLTSLVTRVPSNDTHPQRDGASWLWLVVCPFAALALLVALAPPGLLWAEEGFGYDALEYHLQMPREYVDAGRITYAPHNVYANFPATAEMLYLLAMVVEGGALAGVTVAKLINALLMVLVVTAAWLAGREVGPRVGVWTGLLAASTGWLTYLSGVAYVENAMLFFGMLSAAGVIRASDAEDTAKLRWITVAGLLAGLSAGYKYTAVVLIVLPLGLAVLASRWSSVRRRAIAVTVFAVAACATFTPWMAKNVVLTGNPVFPLAGEVFRAYPDGWSAECSAHFDRSHAPGPDESSISARVAGVWDKVIADDSQRFGPAVFALGVIGLIVRRRNRIAVQFGLVLLAQIVLWLSLTHLYARFAVVYLIPLVVLGGRALGDLKTAAQKAGLVVLLVGMVWNLTALIGLYREHLYTDAGRVSIEGSPEVFTRGLSPAWTHLRVINHELPADAKVLLVGEARAFYFTRRVDYSVVFNRSPFIDVAETAADSAELHRWLADNGYTHIYVDWDEVNRLRRSRYGFPDIITRELFSRWIDAGVLRRGPAFRSDAGRAPYGELYETIRN